MKKYFEKHETLFCILLIVAYVIANSYCMQNFGHTSVQSLILNTIFSALLILLIIILKRVDYYGLVKVTNPKKFFYFIPLILIASVNLWNGFNTSESAGEIIVCILVMVNIGFIEEIIFRGFLFKMMATDNVKSAIIVSSLTFGIGHIVNLLNGADFLPTLIQMTSAISIGYLFVIIFIRSKSLIPCILTHIVINSTSVFNTAENSIFAYVVLIVVPVVYAIYINRSVKEQQNSVC